MKTDIEKYNQRNIRWSEISINQLSYYNNLLLSLQILFLSYSFKPEQIKLILFTISNMCWSETSMIISIILTAISILIGLLISITRLLDFKLTRQINQIRQRMLKYSKIKLDKSSPDSYSFWKRNFLLFSKQPSITIEECKLFKKKLTLSEKTKILCNFRKLRNLSHNLGISTWRYTKIQTLIFALSISSYIIALLT